MEQGTHLKEERGLWNGSGEAGGEPTANTPCGPQALEGTSHSRVSAGGFTDLLDIHSNPLPVRPHVSLGRSMPSGRCGLPLQVESSQSAHPAAPCVPPFFSTSLSPHCFLYQPLPTPVALPLGYKGALPFNATQGGASRCQI